MTAFILALGLLAQSPNTATDQTGAIVQEAQVSIVNADTGLSRDGATGRDGSVTIAALPIVGTYSVTVLKPGFQAQTAQGVILRAGEPRPSAPD